MKWENRNVMGTGTPNGAMKWEQRMLRNERRVCSRKWERGKGGCEMGNGCVVEMATVR